MESKTIDGRKILIPLGTVLWSGGKVARHDTSWDYWEDVNASGVIAGRTSLGAIRIRADGTVEQLPTNPSWSTRQAGAYRINAAGDIAGVAYPERTAPVVVVWPAASPGTYRVLKAPWDLSDVSPIVEFDDQGSVVAKVSYLENDVTTIRKNVIWNAAGSMSELSGDPKEYYPVGMRDGIVGGMRVQNFDRTAVVEWDLTGRKVRESAMAGQPFVEAVGGQRTIGGMLLGGVPQTKQLPTLWRDGAVLANLPIGNPALGGSVRTVGDDGLSAAGTQLRDALNADDAPVRLPATWSCS